MKVNVHSLIEVYKTSKKIKEVAAGQDIYGPLGKKIYFKYGHKLNKEDLDYLQSNKINFIEIVLDRHLLKEFHDIDPITFRLPNGVEKIADIKKEIGYLKKANENSQVERFLICCDEVRDENGNLLVEYGKKVEILALELIEKHHGEEYYLAYRFSEHKILLYVNLLTIGENFKERFYFNSNIVMALIKYLNSFRILNNLTKLNIEKDFFIVDDPKKLAHTYRSNDVRLIVIGEAIDDEYRRGLIEVKKMDPYARFMLANKSNPENIEQFLLDVELNYSRNNYK